MDYTFYALYMCICITTYMILYIKYIYMHVACFICYIAYKKIKVSVYHGYAKRKLNKFH